MVDYIKEVVLIFSSFSYEANAEKNKVHKRAAKLGSTGICF